MNKWRLLLLSVLSLLQSASTEQNFVVGRNRYRWSDTRFSSHEPYRLLRYRQLDIRSRSPPVQDKYDGRDYPTRFRVRAQNDRLLNRQSTYDFNEASGTDVGRYRIARDYRDYRKHPGSISTLRNNNNKKEDTRFHLHGTDEMRNYDDVLNRYKRNSRDAIIHNIRIRMYDGQTIFLNRYDSEQDATRRIFRERDFLERDSKGISLYGDKELRRQTTNNVDSIGSSNNLYRSSSEDVTRRNVMNRNRQEKDISRYNSVRKYASNHNCMRNSACNNLARQAILSDESCIANTRKSEFVTRNVRDDVKNNARHIAINEIAVKEGPRMFCPEKLNNRSFDTRTANIILRRNIESDIPKETSRNLSTQIRKLNDVYKRNIRDRTSALRRSSFTRDIRSRNVFSTDFIHRINNENNNFQEKTRIFAMEQPDTRLYKQDFTLRRQKEFSPEHNRRDTLRRSNRLSIRDRQYNELQNISQMQRDSKQANQMENVRNIRRGRVLNIQLNNRRQHSVQKRFVRTIGSRNSCKDRSRNLSTHEARRNTDKLECTSNARDEMVLKIIHLTPESRMKQFSNLYDNERSTETSKLTRRERSRSVSFREGVTNKIGNVRNKQEKLINVQRMALIFDRQNVMPKLHVSKISEDNAEHIIPDRSTLSSIGQRARYMQHISPASIKQSIRICEGSSSENRNIQDKRYRSTRYIEVGHHDRSRSLTIEKRGSYETRTRHTREERLQDVRYTTPFNREKRVMLSRQTKRMTRELEKTKYIYSERRASKQVSSNEREHSIAESSIKQLDHADNVREDKLRTRTRPPITNEIQHSYYTRGERLPHNENIRKSFANARIIKEEKLERRLSITRHTKVNMFTTRERNTSLVRHSVLDKGLQINKSHTTIVCDMQNSYRNTIHRTNENNIRDRKTDTRRISITKQRQCTSTQCSIITTSIMKYTDIENIFESKWQFLFYLLQGIYLWSLFIKMPKTNGETNNYARWLTDYMKIH